MQTTRRCRLAAAEREDEPGQRRGHHADFGSSFPCGSELLCSPRVTLYTVDVQAVSGVVLAKGYYILTASIRVVTLHKNKAEFPPLPVQPTSVFVV